MSKEIIKLPCFEAKKDSITYLGQYEYLSFKNSHLSHEFKSKILSDEGVIISRRPIKKNPKTTKKILVVEPHPDDFALSASGYALNALQEGADLLIFNLFSRTSISKFPWRGKITISEDQYEKLRLQESEIAIEDYLGEKFESLRIPSTSVRSESATFSFKHNEDGLVSQITQKLVDRVNEKKIDTILCPMAIQGHTDHLVAFDAVIKAHQQFNQQIKLVFYEDLPYARNKTAYSKRIQQIKLLVEIEEFYIATEPYLDIIADLIIIYRSQFDDINRNQMLAIIKEDFRTTALDYNAKNDKQTEFAQRYFLAKEFK